jgi:glycine betaine/choline ABC-type transport system substrate-binding protein
MKAALEEPHTDDILFNHNGLNIFVQKGLGAGNVSITVDYSGSVFTAALEQEECLNS